MTPTGRPGGTLSGDEVRTRLHSALDAVTANERVAELVAAAHRRRRTRWWVAGGAGVAVAGATAAAVVVLGVPAPDGPAVVTRPGHSRLSTVAARKSLARYVRQHHGTNASGPISPTEPYAAYVQNSMLRLVRFDGHRWIAEGPAVDSPEPGVPVVATHVAALRGLVGFQVDAAGADAVINGVFVRTNGGWQYAGFNCGGTTSACADGPGHRTTFTVDATIRHGRFHSEMNSCRPNCAAGTRYDVLWRWRRNRAGAGDTVEFVVERVRPVP